MKSGRRQMLMETCHFLSSFFFTAETRKCRAKFLKIVLIYDYIYKPTLIKCGSAEVSHYFLTQNRNKILLAKPSRPLNNVKTILRFHFYVQFCTQSRNNVKRNPLAYNIDAWIERRGFKKLTMQWCYSGNHLISARHWIPNVLKWGHYPKLFLSSKAGC